MTEFKENSGINDENKRENAKETEINNNASFPHLLHPRYQWIDQFRGLVILLLFIASFTWIFSSDMSNGEVPPIGPTWLNHGWKYYNGPVPIITIIDLGAQIFMFVLGISMAISFRSKRKKMGLGYAWTKVITRFFAFIWINEVSRLELDLGTIGITGLIIFLAASAFCIYFGLVIYRKSNKKALFGMIWAIFAAFSWFLIGSGAGLTLWTAFFNEPLAHLAWGTLAAAIFINLIDKPDRRIYVVAGFFVLHFLLQFFDQGAWLISASGSITNGLGVPYDVLGHMAIAITATCIWDWMNMDPSDQKIGIKKRVIPMGVFFFIFAFMWDFIVPANHHGTNDALAALAIATGSLVSVVFWDYEHTHKLRVPLLTELGRNAILLYLLQAAFTLPYDELFNAQMLWAYGWPIGPLLGLVLAIVPIVGLSLVAVILHRKKIYFKF